MTEAGAPLEEADHAFRARIPKAVLVTAPPVLLTIAAP
jgi:hypothetical protein